MKTCPNCRANYTANFSHCPVDGTALLDTGEWQEGTVIRGKYRIISVVGEGGMAVVYKAMHTRFRELRALKAISRELAGKPEFVKRFLREAVLTRKIQHCNAVRVDDIDEAEDGRPFIVMEYVEGRSLKEVIHTEAPMSGARVCSIAKEVASALYAAHRLGIVHRDVKPANIVLVSEGSPFTASPEKEHAKVLDFGIAKVKELGAEDITHSHMTVTGTGSVIGTPAYMSPEQARGMKGDQLDGRSDIYSLGMVMYEMLAGGMPFEADTSMEWILAHVQTPPKPLEEARPELAIPSDLARLVMRCLAKDRDNRPPTAEALAGEIEAVEQGASATRVFPFEASNWPWPEASNEGSRCPVPSTVASEPVSARYRQAGTLEVPKQSRGSSGWVSAGVVGLLIAVGVTLWVTNPWARPPLSKGSGTVEVTPTVPQPKNTPSTNTATPGSASAGYSGSAPALDSKGAAPKTSDQPVSSKVQETSGAEGSGGAASAGVSSGASTQAEQSAEAQRRDEAQLRQREVADIVARAKDREGQGNYEAALQDYEQASRLDPSNITLKHNIRRLRGLIARENDALH